MCFLHSHVKYNQSLCKSARTKVNKEENIRIHWMSLLKQKGSIKDFETSHGTWIPHFCLTFD